MSNYERNLSFHSLFTFQNIWNPPDHFRVRARQNKNENGAQYFQAAYQRHPVYQKALSGLQASSNPTSDKRKKFIRCLKE